MNIFVLDKSPELAAQYLDDKRVKHMPLECIELLAIYLHSITGEWKIQFPLWGTIERVSQPNFLYDHPCSKWIRFDKANMTWLYYYTVALLDEHEHRFNSCNAVQNVFISLRPYLSIFLVSREQQPVAFQNSSMFKQLPVVEAYRRTMCNKWVKIDKIKPPKFTNREIPDWVKEQTKFL